MFLYVYFECSFNSCDYENNVSNSMGFVYESLIIINTVDSMPGCCISELKTRYKGMSEVY